MAKNHGNQIKKDDTYEELRDKGYSKSKSARIANAQANKDMHPSKKGGHASQLEDRSKKDLYEEAKDIGIEGRSNMDKAELIKAIRSGQ